MITKRLVILLLLVAIIVGCGPEETKLTSTEKTPGDSQIVSAPITDWREDYAYSMGVAAMHYAYPYLRMAQVRWDWTQVDVDQPDIKPNRMLNEFWHSTGLIGAEWRAGAAPNNDTLYSFAWIHAVQEPVILSIPEVDRYYTFEMVGANSDNFAYVSEMTHGRKAGSFALLPRGWQGELPAGVEVLAEVPSPWFVVIGRTYLADEADIPAVRLLQEQYRLVPLSQWGQDQAVVAKPPVFKPYDQTSDPLAVWKTINHMLTENPPIDGEVALMSFFREINIGPGLDVDALADPFKRGLERAAVDSFSQIQKAQITGAGKSVLSNNGWLWLETMGRGADHGDFFARTVHQSYGGIAGNDPAEAIYFAAFAGSDGTPLDGNKRYRIDIPTGAELDVKAFWSVSLYDQSGNFADNEIGRYSIGDRTLGLVRDASGSLILALQQERPDEMDVNWLPTPEGRFWLILRAYQPGPGHLSNEQPLPPVTLVE